MNRKHIYFLINSLEGWWAERVIVTLSRLFQKMGFNVTIFTLKDAKKYTIHEWVRYIPLSSTKHNIIMLLLIPISIWKLKNYISQWSFINGISFLELSNFVHIFSRKNAIISFRTSIGIFHGISGFIYKFFIKILYPKAKKIIVNSVENEYKFRKWLWIPKEKISTIYNPIDSEEINLLAEENIAPDIEKFCEWKTVFLTTGRLIKSKNHQKILSVFSQFKNTPNVLLIAGDWPLEKQLITYSENLWITQQVKFLWFQKNIFSLINRCDYFIYASSIEGFPNALIEAIALWKPIITSDFETGARECIFESYNDWNIKYPSVWKNGAILWIKSFEEDFVAFLPHINTLLSKYNYLSDRNIFINNNISKWIKIITNI